MTPWESAYLVWVRLRHAIICLWAGEPVRMIFYTGSVEWLVFWGLAAVAVALVARSLVRRATWRWFRSGVDG